jgi:competence protein ComFC
VVLHIDVVTWVPTSPSRRRKRGFDQAELLAAHVALLLGVPKVQLLEHVSDPGSQTGRSRIARLKRSQSQLFVPARQAGSGCFQTVLLVDDVVTTGGTLSAAVRMLKDNGSNTVHAVVAAATL